MEIFTLNMLGDLRKGESYIKNARILRNAEEGIKVVYYTAVIPQMEWGGPPNYFNIEPLKVVDYVENPSKLDPKTIEDINEQSRRTNELIKSVVNRVNSDKRDLYTFKKELWDLQKEDSTHIKDINQYRHNIKEKIDVLEKKLKIEMDVAKSLGLSKYFSRYKKIR